MRDEYELSFMVNDGLISAASYLEAKAERQRHLDMCEDGGLVFCLPELLNPYSAE